MATATAQLLVDGGISDGAPGPDAVQFLPANHRITIGGKVETISFWDEYQQPSGFAIRKQMSFDLDDPVQKHNHDLLNLLLKMPQHEQLKSRIKVMNPEADSILLAERVDKEHELLGILKKHQTDGEWLRPLYRRVVGPASGIPVIALYIALTNKAKEGADAADRVSGKYGLDHFLTVDGKWVFEDDYFETRALLDLCLERGEIIRDGENYKRRNDPSKILAHDEAKMLYVLQNDATLRDYFKERVNAPAPSRDRPTGYALEDSSLVRMAQGLLGTSPAESKPASEQTPRPLDAQAQQTAQLSALIDRLGQTSPPLISEVDGVWTVEEVPDAFASREEVIDYLRVNPQTVLTLE